MLINSVKILFLIAIIADVCGFKIAAVIIGLVMLLVAIVAAVQN